MFFTQGSKEENKYFLAQTDTGADDLHFLVVDLLCLCFNSFAIDWRPSQRLLVYLKSATVVCHLQVEEGYPSSGVVRLQGIVREGQTVDISGLKVRRSVELLKQQ